MKLKKAHLITCLLPKGSARELVDKLRTKMDLTTASVSHARGTGVSAPTGPAGIGEQIEKDVLTVVAPEDRANEVFEYLYFELEIYKPHHGFMYMTRELQTLPYELPEMPANAETN